MKNRQNEEVQFEVIVYVVGAIAIGLLLYVKYGVILPAVVQNVL